MFVCIHLFMHVCELHMCVLVYICFYVCIVCICMYMFEYLWMYACVWVYACMCLCVWMHACVNAYICVFACVCMCVHVHLWRPEGTIQGVTPQMSATLSFETGSLSGHSPNRLVRWPVNSRAFCLHLPSARIGFPANTTPSFLKCDFWSTISNLCDYKISLYQLRYVSPGQMFLKESPYRFWNSTPRKFASSLLVTGQSLRLYLQCCSTPGAFSTTHSSVSFGESIVDSADQRIAVLPRRIPFCSFLPLPFPHF